MERSKNNTSTATAKKLSQQIQKFSSEIKNIKGLYKSLANEYSDNTVKSIPNGKLKRSSYEELKRWAISSGPYGHEAVPESAQWQDDAESAAVCERFHFSFREKSHPVSFA